jgi:SAM-dependent methyltransferase
MGNEQRTDSAGDIFLTSEPSPSVASKSPLCGLEGDGACPDACMDMGSRKVMDMPEGGDVRDLFNLKAGHWRSKYGPEGKLNARVGQFVARLTEFCLPPSDILDFGCGTGEIATAVSQRGYSVTACDFAEEMIAVARANPDGKKVNWSCLQPDWKYLPFENGGFDGIIASSVFEYLDDVPRVAAQLARVLRPGGKLLLTVPNPFNLVRKLENWFPSALLQRLPLLHRAPAVDSYCTYLRLSRNRFRGAEWESHFNVAGLLAVDRYDFSNVAWRSEAHAPLILLAVKKRMASAAAGRAMMAAKPAADLSARLDSAS